MWAPKIGLLISIILGVLYLKYDERRLFLLQIALFLLSVGAIYAMGGSIF